MQIVQPGVSGYARQQMAALPGLSEQKSQARPRLPAKRRRPTARQQLQTEKTKKKKGNCKVKNQTTIDELLPDAPIRTHHFGVDVAEVQRQHRVWAERNFGDKFNAEAQVLGIIEEVGELAAAWLIDWRGSGERGQILMDAAELGARAHRLLKAYTGIRQEGSHVYEPDENLDCHVCGQGPHATQARRQILQQVDKKPELLRDAVGDIQFYLIGLATKLGLSADLDVIAITWADVRCRDWVKFPKNGYSE